MFAQIMKQFNIDPEKAQAAWKMAKDMGAGVQTKQQALKILQQKGIDRQALEKMSGYFNHPAAIGMAKFAGVNLEKMKQDFNSLLYDANAVDNKTSNGTDPLSKYRHGYKQL